MVRLNYDEIAERYDEPARDHVVDPDLVRFLTARSEPPTSAVRVLDIGCGTGKQLAANRRQFAALVHNLSAAHRSARFSVRFDRCRCTIST